MYVNTRKLKKKIKKNWEIQKNRISENFHKLRKKNFFSVFKKFQLSGSLVKIIP